MRLFVMARAAAAAMPQRRRDCGLVSVYVAAAMARSRRIGLDNS
jgi:hypothetical protein